jgi:hypothetical protein
MALSAAASPGTTQLSLTDPTGSIALAITGQVLSITGATGLYTVTNDTFPATGTHTPDVVQITPALVITAPPVKGVQKPLAVKAAVTVSPTTTTPNRTVNDASFSGATLTSASAHFVAGDVGATIQGEVGAVKGAGGTAIGNTAGNYSSLTIASINSSTSVTLSGTAGEQTSAGPPASYAAPVSGTAVVTIGQTLIAPQNVYGVNNVVASSCTTTGAVAAGDFAPLTATMVGVTATALPNSAIALEAAPPETTFSVTYPTIGSGWVDNGGGGAAAQPTTSIHFPGGKDNVFSEAGGQGACGSGQINCDSYTKGVATGDWPSTKGNLGLSAYGLVFCTLAEIQAINNNTGPDASANGGWINGGNNNPLVVCDGGSSNPNYNQASNKLKEEAALQVIITLELNPSANAYGSDNTPPASIWNADASNGSNVVF